MRQLFSAYKYIFITLFVLSVIIITVFYSILKPKETLPIYQPAMVNSELVDTTMLDVKKYHKIGAFSLTNQNGKQITEHDYDGKIYVADFFFTTCQSICPVMTTNMYTIQQKITHDNDVMLLSHSVTPEIDSVAQLKRYALEKKVNDAKWNLVTGDRKQIYDLARKSYLVAKNDTLNPYGMIHTENFVLVDKEKRIRGFYDGTNTEAIQKLLKDIKTLQKSYSN